MSPVRRYLDSRGYQYSAAVVIYAEIVIITVAALIILAVAGVWLLGQYRSQDGLSGPEITLLVTGLLAALNQASIWRVGAQAKAIGREVNGHLDDRLDNQSQQIRRSIDQDARYLHGEHKREHEQRGE